MVEVFGLHTGRAGESAGSWASEAQVGTVEHPETAQATATTPSHRKAMKPSMGRGDGRWAEGTVIMAGRVQVTGEGFRS